MSHDQAFPVVRYDCGVQMAGSSLWLDAPIARDLCMITTLEHKLPPTHRRVLASAPMADMLAKGGYASAVLPVPWRRPVGVGGCQVELIDTGHPLGFAHVLLTVGTQRVLYLGKTRATTAPLPEAEHVVVSLPALAQQENAVDVDRAVRHIESFLTGSEASAVEVDHAGLAVVLYQKLAKKGVLLQPVGLLSKWLTPPDVSSATRAQLPVMQLPGKLPAKVKRVCGVTMGYALPTQADKVIRVAWLMDMSDVRKVVRAVGAQHVWMDGVEQTHQYHVANALAFVAESHFLELRAQLSIF